MSLFPDGASKGMGSFRGSSQNTQNDQVSSVIPEKVETPSFVDILEKQNPEETLQGATSQNVLIEEEVQSIPVKMEMEEASFPVILEGKKEIEKKELKAAPLSNTTGDFPSSVRIAGLTTDTDMLDIPAGEELDPAFLSENEEMALNLTESEKEELEEADDVYFQEFSSERNPFGGIALDELLNLAIDNDASDIHFAAQEKIGIRMNGKIHFIENIPPLSMNQARALVFSMVPNPLHRRRIFEDKELDSAYEHKNGVNFRVNIFFKRGRIGGVLRKIASHAMTLEQLGLPAAIRPLLNKKQGLLLVTGPTGSGKSTSMQSMLEYINENRVEHILTIEDPIEYIFHPKKSIFSQREVGRDTFSFANALRASLREDPDVVMIGEMRDAETIQAAMQLSETGHLVISTLHTSSAPQTIARLVSNFPSSEQEQVQSRLADTLIGVLSQRLIPRIDREGRVAIFELMIVNSAIRNIIRTGDMTQIHNAMMSGREAGMVLMPDYAAQLEAQGIVSEESYKNFFREE